MVDLDLKETLEAKALPVALAHLVIRDRLVTMAGLALREHQGIPDSRVPLDSRAVKVLQASEESKDKPV